MVSEQRKEGFAPINFLDRLQKPSKGSPQKLIGMLRHRYLLALKKIVCLLDGGRGPREGSVQGGAYSFRQVGIDVFFCGFVDAASYTIPRRL